MKFEVDFLVKATTLPGESVFIVGNFEELGNWNPNRAKQLFLVNKDENDGLEVWSCTIKLTVAQGIEYRYFIGYFCETDHEGESHDTMVRVWETNLLPRRFSMKEYCLQPETSNSSISVFGYYDGRKSIDKGWITCQTEVHLRLYANPIHMWKRQSMDVVYRVKCTTIDLRYKDTSYMETDDEESNHELIRAGVANEVEVSVLNGVDNIPSAQPQFGTPYIENSFIVFRAQTVEPEFMGYQFDFYMQHPSASPGDIPRHIGTSYVLPINLGDSVGRKTVPINGLKHRPIGQLTVEHLIIKPMKTQLCNAQVSYSNYWKHRRRALDVGHRGMGSSHCKQPKECAAVRENTIASLSEAGGHGADFVEFDVQLSKDKVPVIYHDLIVALTLKKKEGMQHELFQIPIKDLKIDQLQALHVHHKSEVDKGFNIEDSPPIPMDPIEKQPFPTLQQCMEHLDPHIGFCLEVKYLMQMKSGEMEEDVDNFMEMNEYVDRILDVVLRHGGSRRIVISCFNPDICTLIRRKQNRYPVMFLCNGDIPKHAPYKDERTWNLINSANFVHCEKLLGICPCSDSILAKPEILDVTKSFNLIVFCWGETNNNVENIRKLKEMGVDAVIFDRIYELKSEKQNIFHMEQAIKSELLTKMGLIGKSTHPIHKMSSVDIQIDTGIITEEYRKHRLAST